MNMEAYMRFRGLLGFVGSIIFLIAGIIIGSISMMIIGAVVAVICLLLFVADYYLSTT
jgi:hypothetical protein